MIDGLLRLGRYVQLFGKKHGIQLYFNIRNEKFDKITLPNIKSKISLRNGTPDVYVFYQIFTEKEYDFPLPDNDPKVIIDGGANIGLFTVLMKNKFPNAKVICIEPDKENFAMLQKNTSTYDNIHYENCGLWNRQAHLKVYDKFQMGKWAMVVEESEENTGLEALSITDIMTKYELDTIDILKLDIESSEKFLFQNNYDYWLSRTRWVIIELHDLMKGGCSKTFFSAINKTFTNYECFTRGENILIINKDLA